MAFRSSGIAGLNEILGGGIPKTCATLLHGPTGTGKTIFGLQFLLEGLKKGEKTAYVTLDHKPQRFIEQAKSFAWELEEYMNCDLFSFIDITEEKVFESPESFKKIWKRLLDFIDNEKINRVVIDPFRFLATEYSFMCAYREVLLKLDAIKGSSSLVIIHSKAKTIPTESNWCSGVIALDLAENTFGMTRQLLIQKFTGLDFNLNSTRYFIDKELGFYIPVQSKVGLWQPS